MAKGEKSLLPATTIQAIDRYFNSGLVQIQADEVAGGKSFRVGVARTRFKEGFTTEDQFRAELEALRVIGAEIDQELVAGRLDYATDYTRDMITVFREAVRSGNLGLDGYLDQLLALGIVPIRAVGYVVRERARLKPTEAPGVGPLALPYYETEAGKVQVDTIRRRRRKNQITRDQELAELLALGTPQDLAESWTENDDIRLSSKEGD